MIEFLVNVIQIYLVIAITLYICTYILMGKISKHAHQFVLTWPTWAVVVFCLWIKEKFE